MKPATHSLFVCLAIPCLLLMPRALAQGPALKELDPVLLTKGQEVAGKPELTVQEGQYLCHFADAANQATFRAEPGRYEIQFGGGCGRMGPRSGAGDAARFAVHGERMACATTTTTGTRTRSGTSHR